MGFVEGYRSTLSFDKHRSLEMTDRGGRRVRLIEDDGQDDDLLARAVGTRQAASVRRQLLGAAGVSKREFSNFHELG